MTTSPARSGRALHERRDPVETPDGVEVDLGWALGHVFRSYIKAFNVAVDTLPGGARGYQILSAAAHETPGSQLVLAQRLGIDRTVLTYLLDDLVSAGLVERQPDPTDRRARRIVATAAGKRSLRNLCRQIAHIEDDLLATLDSDDRNNLRSLLKRVALHAQQRDPDADLCEAAELAK
jgi:DNA-binding MarR family transcriptional regulator